MDTRLSALLSNDASALEARELLLSCVHCGFCTATCPTYQLLGDELDGPRGRIYLIRQLLESGRSSAQTRVHLDRCLLCRSCETTCPSGVNYHQLLHLGRKLSGKLKPLPLPQRILRATLRGILPYPRRVRALAAMGRLARPLLPGKIRNKIPARQRRKPLPGTTHARKVLLFQGCVQSAVAQGINDATRRVLDRLGIECLTVAREHCCGAVPHHLDAENQAREMARHNIDQWLPLLRDGAEALLITSSACALEIQEYPQLFTDDPALEQKAIELLQHCQEIGSFLHKQETKNLQLAKPRSMAFHAPCTLQHGLVSAEHTTDLLSRLGFELHVPRDNHLCCGSAGTYSLQHPRLADELRRNKLDALTEIGTDCIASANIGCLLHLQETSPRPVKHWMEWLDEILEQQSARS
ncbi:glycolate oxidase subunit GlcF [Thiolapillus sp.]